MTTLAEKLQYSCELACPGCGETLAIPAGYPALLYSRAVDDSRYCMFREHPFYCPRADLVFAGRPASEEVGVGWKFAIPDLSHRVQSAFAGERGILLVGPRCPSMHEPDVQLKAEGQKLRAPGDASAPDPRSPPLGQIPIDTTGGWFDYTYQDSWLWLWQVKTVSKKKVLIATFSALGEGTRTVRLADSGCIPARNTRDARVVFAFALVGDELVLVAGGPGNVRVSVYDAAETKAKPKTLKKKRESQPLSDEPKELRPISVRACANGWLCVKVEVPGPEGAQTVCHFFSPDLATRVGGRAGVYPSSEVRHVPPCTPGSLGCFVFDSNSPGASDPRVGINEMRRLAQISPAGTEPDGSGDALFVDTEGLLDAADADLAPPLLAKKHFLRPLVRIESATSCTSESATCCTSGGGRTSTSEDLKCEQ